MGSAFYKHAQAIYQEIKSQFWDSDLYIQHGFNSHLGFFPFCTHENSKIISDKIILKYEAYKLANPEIQEHTISQTASTCPTDGETAADLLEALDARITDPVKKTLVKTGIATQPAVML